RHTRSDRDWSSDVCSSDLPDPFPRRAEVDDLLGDMAQVAQLFPGFLEALAGALRQITNGLVGFRALARAEVEMSRPVISVWLDHGAPIVQVRSRAGIGPDRAAGHTIVAAPPYGRPAPW